MASVRKRGSTYQIAVSCGYDATGKQIRRTMTYKPDPNMTEKQVQRERRRQTVLFEERCRAEQTGLQLRLGDAWHGDNWIFIQADGKAGRARRGGYVREPAAPEAG